MSQNFEGEESSIGVVLGLCFEKIENKVPFKIFRDNMGYYISRTMKYVNKVVGIVETYEDVWSTYKANHMPKYLIIEDKQSEFKLQIQNQRIKMYVTK